MGATNPENALAGTLRADYADSLTENAAHGSDSLESAQREIAYFLQESEICHALVNRCANFDSVLKYGIALAEDRINMP
jgi:hypothetical protein